MVVIKFDINARTQWQVGKGSSGVWIAVCDPLSLVVEGDTWDEMTKLVAHSIDVLFRDLLEVHELERFLADHGWTPTMALPTSVPHEGIRFDLPFEFERMAESVRAVG